jgi:hypothetical protein
VDAAAGRILDGIARFQIASLISSVTLGLMFDSLIGAILLWAIITPLGWRAQTFGFDSTRSRYQWGQDPFTANMDGAISKWPGRRLSTMSSVSLVVHSLIVAAAAGLRGLDTTFALAGFAIGLLNFALMAVVWRKNEGALITSGWRW